MRSIWGKVSLGRGDLSRDLKEVRDIGRKSCPNRGNCKSKSPKGKRAIYSDGEDSWEVDDFYFGHTALRCLQDIWGW